MLFSLSLSLSSYFVFNISHKLLGTLESWYMHYTPIYLASSCSWHFFLNWIILILRYKNVLKYVVPYFISTCKLPTTNFLREVNMNIPRCRGPTALVIFLTLGITCGMIFGISFSVTSSVDTTAIISYDNGTSLMNDEVANIDTTSEQTRGDPVISRYSGSSASQDNSSESISVTVLIRGEVIAGIVACS